MYIFHNEMVDLQYVFFDVFSYDKNHRFGSHTLSTISLQLVDLVKYYLSFLLLLNLFSEKYRVSHRYVDNFGLNFEN